MQVEHIKIKLRFFEHKNGIIYTYEFKGENFFNYLSEYYPSKISDFTEEDYLMIRDEVSKNFNSQWKNYKCSVVDIYPIVNKLTKSEIEILKNNSLR